MRTFSALDVFRARDAGIYVLGLSDHSAGVGRQYLLSLGVDQVVVAGAVHELGLAVPQFSHAPGLELVG